MGTTQSTHTTSETKEPSFSEKVPNSSVSGRKESNEIVHVERSMVSTDDEVVSTASSEDSYSSDEDSDEEEDEEWNERRQILLDAKKLRGLALDYLQPERPVTTTDPCATGRNYFTRASAEEYEEEDDMDDRDDILADMKELKAQAEMYLMPEKPVEVDPLATCRNYFDRASAPQSEDNEEALERAQILADVQQLKKLAEDYLHPEKPVVCNDPTAMGRNYFSRASAEEFDGASDAKERVQVLADAQQLKKLAVDYLQPEKPVVCNDPTAMGRNYFARASAPEREDFDLARERDLALADAQQMKTLASHYIAGGPVEVDPLATARCYFDRPSSQGHKDHIHSMGYSLNQGNHGYELASEPLDHHTTYYHSHHHDDHCSQSDHFEMDEDAMYNDIRESLQLPEPFKGEHPKETEEEGEEGKLSRSPSCVMLFDEAAAM